MTKFVDLHLCTPLKNDEQSKKIIAKSAELGYQLVAVPFPPLVKQEEVERIKKICSDVGIDLSTRVDLSPKDKRELLSSLRSFRRRFEVVSVLCTSKPVARQAARDRRVDLLSFPIAGTRKTFFDGAEAELASESFASLEIDMAQLLLFEGFQRTRCISTLRREATVAKRFGVPVILSSGEVGEYLLRKPQDYASLAMLFDMDLALALKALSDVPLTIVQRNRQKLSPEFVAPGISIVRRRDPYA